MSFEVVFVFLALIGMITALVMDKMRPGMILLTVVVLFLVCGYSYSEGNVGRLQQQRDDYSRDAFPGE